MAPIKLFFNSFLLLPLLFLSAFSDPDRCYSPNGEVSKSLVACWHPDHGRTGLCCEPGDLCLNNTLCAKKGIASSFQYYRGACLDHTWSDPGCPDFCTLDWQNVDTLNVYSCTDRDGTHWSCDEHATLQDGPCFFDGGSFDIHGDMDVYATAGVKPKPSTSAEDSTTAEETTTEGKDIPSTTNASGDVEPSLGQPTDTTVTDSSRASSETPPMETATEPTTTQSSAPPLNIPLDTGTTPGPRATPSDTLPDAVASPPMTAPFSPPQHEGNSSAAIPIGVGVAVGTSVLIASSALVFFYQRKRRRHAPARAETPPPFEFDLINNQAPSWLGPSYGPKAPEMQGTSKNMPELGGTARAELP